MSKQYKVGDLVESGPDLRLITEIRLHNPEKLKQEWGAVHTNCPNPKYDILFEEKTYWEGQYYHQDDGLTVETLDEDEELLGKILEGESK